MEKSKTFLANDGVVQTAEVLPSRTCSALQWFLRADPMPPTTDANHQGVS